jgi:hypothetical protein
MEILGRLFGSEAKAKIVRLFLFNPEAQYTIAEISVRAAVTSVQARAILAALLKLGLIRKKIAIKETTKEIIKKDKKKVVKIKKSKEIVYFLDQKFPYANILSDLMAEASVRADNRLVAKLMPAGKIKLVIVSGIFTRQSDARLDLLIAGDDINESRLANIIGSLEIEIGRDLSYSNLTTADLEYRLGLHDRLIRDVIDFPHIVLLDKIGFQTRK